MADKLVNEKIDPATLAQARVNGVHSVMTGHILSALQTVSTLTALNQNEMERGVRDLEADLVSQLKKTPTPDQRKAIHTAFKQMLATRAHECSRAQKAKKQSPSLALAPIPPEVIDAIITLMWQKIVATL